MNLRGRPVVLTVMTNNRLGPKALALRIAVPAVALAAAAACGSSSAGSGSTLPAGGNGSAGAAGTTLETRSGGPGTFLADGAGRSLYLFTSDSAGRSSCSGACTTAWPPLTSRGPVTAGTGVAQSQISLIGGSNGAKQVAYDGHPLYYYAGDGAAGQTTGEGNQGFGASWWLVSPSGQALTTSGGGSAPSTSSTAPGSAGGYGY